MKNLPIYTTSYLRGCKNTNRELDRCFQQARVNQGRKESHLFNGRYENIYISEKLIPCVKTVLNQAQHYASAILGLPASGLKHGFWFNDMRPGDNTGPHCHDDDDELLSAVYYVNVPENSGRLLLHDCEQTAIAPTAGMFVFFSPTLVHEVEENRSRQNRLSIGINIGPASSQV